MPDGAPYALAGLFSEWRPRKGKSHRPLDTFSIVTTEANELTEPIMTACRLSCTRATMIAGSTTMTMIGLRSISSARMSRKVCA